MSIIEKISLILTFTLKAIVIYFFNATLKRKTYSFFILTPQSLQVQYPPIGILQELSFLKSLVDHLSHQLLLYQQL